MNYDPYLINPNTTLIQPDPNVKSYNTFNNYNNPIQTSHLVDPSSDSKPSQVSNKNSKRMNKKNKSKGSADLNNPENAEFSKHYTEDVNSLLEFINSSSSSANPNENKNKTVKKSEPTNKKEKANKANTNEKAQARTKSNDNNKNQNNNNAKRKSSNETENSETKKPDEKLNKPNEAKPPKPEQEVVQDTKANEQTKKLEINPASQEKPSPPVRPSIEEHYDELSSLMESASIKSNDEEFVIVKGGRKLRKSNKTNETAAPTQQIPPATNQLDTNKNKNFKAQSNKNQPQPQPSSIKQENAKPTAKPTNQSSQQPSAKPTNISYNKIVKKDEPNVVNTQASSNQAQTSAKLKQDENKSSATKTTTENSITPTFLDKQSGIDLEVFPPLTPANLNVDSKPATETTKDKVEATEPTNKLDKPVVSANQDKGVEAEAKPSSNQAANSKTTTKKANKLEFLDFRGSNSVIFLDEISQNKASTLENETKASQNTQQLKQKLAVTSNVLNGIKFGFIDSSSSDDDETNNKSGLGNYKFIFLNYTFLFSTIKIGVS